MTLVISIPIFPNNLCYAASKYTVDASQKSKWTNGLVGYWTFDGPDMDWSQSSAEARDQSGQGNHGNVTNFGKEAVRAGKVGQALSFDEVDDYALINDFSYGPEFTVSFWVNHSNSENAGSFYQYMYSHGGWQTQNSVNIYFCENSGTYPGAIMVAILDSNDPVVTPFWTDESHADGKWHLATLVVKTGIGSTFYLDGAYYYNWALGGDAFDPATNIYIGARNDLDADRFYRGKLDEVRVYNRALSEPEIQEIYNAGIKRHAKVDPSEKNKLTNGLVLLQTFDGPDMDWSQATAEARDASGQNNHGDVVGATVISGKVGQALKFDGVDDVVDCGSGSSLDNLGPLTWGAWIYPRSTGEGTGDLPRGRILDKAQKRFAVEEDTSRNLVFGVDGGGILYRTTVNNAFNLNTWSHVAVTWDGSLDYTKIHIYVNGAESTYQYGGNGGSPNNDSSDNLIIGNTVGTTGTFDGLIDEVRVYNRALSPSEVDELYKMGLRKFRP